MSSANFPVEIDVTANDQASSDLSNLADVLKNGTNASDDAVSSVRDMTSNMRLQQAAVNDMNKSWLDGQPTLLASQKAFAQLSTVGHQLMSDFNTLNTAQVNVNTANANLAAATDKASKAQETYNQDLATLGANSPVTQAAYKAMESAVTSEATAKKAATDAQNKYYESLLSVGLTLPNTGFAVAQLAKDFMTVGQVQQMAGTASEGMGVAMEEGATVGETSFTELAASMLTNPVTLIIIAIIAAVVLLYEAWTHNFGGIQDKVKAFVDFFKPYITDALDFVEAYFKAWYVVLTALWDALGAAWHDMTTGLTDAMRDAGNLLTAIWQTAWSGIKTIINYFIGAVDTLISGYDKIAEAINAVSSKVGISLPIFPLVPYLAAEGGIFTSPTLTMLGEAGTEAVIPLSSPSAAQYLGGNGQTVTVLMQFNEPALAKFIEVRSARGVRVING